VVRRPRLQGDDEYFTDSGIPTVFALLAIAAEFLGPLGLAVGLLTRVAAFGIACVMLVATTVHWPHGFFINWYGNQKGEGIEYHLLALGIAITLIIVGAGVWSLDGALASACYLRQTCMVIDGSYLHSETEA
jgi:putative oxidoreductase